MHEIIITTALDRCRIAALRLLHWLHVRQRVQFKLATIVHQLLSVSASAYLADVQCLSPNPSAALWGHLDICHSIQTEHVQRPIKPSQLVPDGPRIWNSLPYTHHS